MPSAAPKLSSDVTLTSFPPALIAFMRTRIEEGATNNELMQEFGVGVNTCTAVRKTTLFSRNHISALKKGLPDAFTAVISASMSAITPAKLEACSAPQLMMVGGIAYDKLRLAQGESTANVSFRDAGTTAIAQSDVVEGLLKSVVAGLNIPDVPLLPPGA